MFIEERSRLTQIPSSRNTAAAWPHGITAAVVQLTYFRTFQRFQVYALFFVCLRALDKARKKVVSTPFQKSRPRSVWRHLRSANFAFVLQCSWQADFFSREVSHHFGLFGPIICVCPPGGAVHTTGFGPVGVFSRLRKGSHLPCLHATFARTRRNRCSFAAAEPGLFVFSNGESFMFCFFFVGPSQYSLFHTAEGIFQGPDGLSGGETVHITCACPRALREADAQGRSWGRQGKRQEVAETTHGNGIISKIDAICSTAARVYLGSQVVETLAPPSETVFSPGLRFLSASVFSVLVPSWSFLLACLRGLLVSCFFLLERWTLGDA